MSRPMSRMPSCREITKMATDYLERRLSLWDRLRFRAHLFLCHDCRVYLRQMTKIIRTLAALPRDMAGAAGEAALLDLFRTSHGGKGPAGP